MPDDKLEVVGDIRLTGTGPQILGDGGDLYIDTENVAGRDLILQYNSGQNVGIGTTAPDQRLTVAGNLTVNQNITGLRLW